MNIPQTPPAAHAGSKPRRRLPVWKKGLFALIVCVCAISALEFVLFVCGVRPYYLESDPYVGFQPGVPLFVRDGDHFRTNPVKLSFFNHQEFPAEKKPGEYRIFCLGGSTTFGHPYHDETSFSGWLRELLKESAPKRSWQVVNCGGISYASYRVCLLMQELVRYQPDLFIVYDGHNEFLERRTYGDLQQRQWTSVAANSILSRTRTGSIASRLLRPRHSRVEKNFLAPEVDTILEHSIGPAEYHRDLQLEQGIVGHFQHSLDRMCALAKSAGAKIIFIKPASNLRNFTPFKSEHGPLSAAQLADWEKQVRQGRDQRATSPGKAAQVLSQAAQADPLYALTHWQTADAQFANRQYSDARQEFLRALDEDVCPLRATTAIRAAVEQAAAANQVPMIDLPSILEQQLTDTDAHGVPGDESFLDHVHHTIDGNGQIAWLLLDQMVQLNMLEAPANRDEVARTVSAKVLARIDKRAEALALVQVIQVLSWAGKNAEALNLADRAEKTCPGLSDVASYRGRLLEKLGQKEEAFRYYAEAVQRNPHDSLATYRYAMAQIAQNKFKEAAQSLERAVEDTPLSAPASFRATLRLTLGKVYLKLQRWNQAETMLDAAIELDPDSTEAQEMKKLIPGKLRL